MASALYPLGKQALLSAGINLLTDTIKIALISTATYTYNAAHQYYSSVTGVIGTPMQITTPTVNSPTPGVFDGADVTFTAVTGAAVAALIIYKDTGVAGTSPLIAYIDGIAVTPNGGDIIVAFDAGAVRIFAL